MQLKYIQNSAPLVCISTVKIRAYAIHNMSAYRHQPIYCSSFPPNCLRCMQKACRTMRPIDVNMLLCSVLSEGARNGAHASIPFCHRFLCETLYTVEFMHQPLCIERMLVLSPEVSEK